MSTIESVLTVQEATTIVRKMKNGQHFVYYRGYIAKDREAAPGVGLLADEMMRHGCPPRYAYGEGTVVDGYGSGELTQRRLGPNDYHYIFTKR